MAQVLRVRDDVGGESGGSDEEPWDEDPPEARRVEEADLGLSRAQVLARIEEFVAEYLAALTADGVPPVLEMVSRGKANQHHAALEGAPAQAGGVAVAIGGQMTRRCLLAGQASGAGAYVRVFKVLQATHELLRTGRTATQRDLYYWLKEPGLFTHPRDLDAAVQDVVALLRVPRVSLGVTCASRGALSGLLRVRDTSDGPWHDCSILGPAGKAIPGDPTAIQAMAVQCSAAYLLIVEKDAVFQRLAQDCVWASVPCVLVTGRGFPDLATRVMCAKIMAQFPRLIPLGLVDYNPHGVLILQTYKFGTARLGLEGRRYALPGLHWLGVRSRWLADVEGAHMHPLNARDQVLIQGLHASLAAAAREASRPVGHAMPALGEGSYPSGRSGLNMFDSPGPGQDETPLVGQMHAWVGELDVMQQAGYKADVEALYSVVGYGGLARVVAEAVRHHDYL